MENTQVSKLFFHCLIDSVMLHIGDSFRWLLCFQIIFSGVLCSNGKHFMRSQSEIPFSTFSFLVVGYFHCTWLNLKGVLLSFVEIVSFLYAILMNAENAQSSSSLTLQEATINLVTEALCMLNFMGTVDLKVLQVSFVSWEWFLNMERRCKLVLLRCTLCRWSNWNLLKLFSRRKKNRGIPKVVLWNGRFSLTCVVLQLATLLHCKLTPLVACINGP